jgi:hypothetical protein
MPEATQSLPPSPAQVQPAGFLHDMIQRLRVLESPRVADNLTRRMPVKRPPVLRAHRQVSGRTHPSIRPRSGWAVEAGG